METGSCKNCHIEFEITDRNPDQKYCGEKPCQNKRESLWRKNKMDTDHQYRQNQKECQKAWAEKNKDYWKKYRKRNPKKAQRNKVLQKVRNLKKMKEKSKNMSSKEVKNIAKIDAFNTSNNKLSGTFWLIPIIAKIDAFKIELIESIEPMNSS